MNWGKRLRGLHRQFGNHFSGEFDEIPKQSCFGTLFFDI